MGCIGVTLCVASQLSKLWRNDSGSTSKQKTFNQIFEYFVDTQNSINKIWMLTLRHVLTESLELKHLCDNIAFVLNNKYTHFCTAFERPELRASEE